MFALLAFLLFGTPGASYAELTITGTKDFQYRAFTVTGSLNQFLIDHPTFLADRGFRQSLRLNINGELMEGVAVDLSLDDTNNIEKDQKLLIKVGGKDFNVTAGRLTLDVPGTRYLLYNKKALAAVGQITRGDHVVTVLAGRPEGDGARDFFRGLGSQAEYRLRNRPVVQGSEIVILDGRSLTRGTDYDFDHEEGVLILNRRLLPVESTSTIQIEYETLAGSGGSGFRSTVVGLRESYRIRKKPRRVRRTLWQAAVAATRPAPRMPAVPPSTLARGPDPGLIGQSTLGSTVVGGFGGPAGYAPDGSSAFPITASVPVPDAFGTPNGLIPPPVPGPLVSLDDHVGATFVLSTDSDSKDNLPVTGSVTPTTPTSAFPRQLGVVGADLAYRFRERWLVTGEVAASFLDPNRRVENPAVRGAAYDLALAHNGDRWDFRIARQHLGPGFEAVGRREFVRLGEAAELSSDLDLTTVSSRFDLTRSVFLDSGFEISETNLGGRRDVPVRDFMGLGNGIAWAYAPGARVLARHRDDVSDLTQPGVVDRRVTHRVRGGSITQPIRGLVTQLRAERAEDRGIDPNLEGDTDTVAVSIGDGSRQRWKWNVTAQDLRFRDTRDTAVREALSVGGTADVAFSRFFNGTLTLLNRNESALLTGEDTTTNTGEVRARYQPTTSLNINSKGSAEQRSRIVRVNADPRLAMVPLPPGQRTVVSEKPVVATNQSHVVDWAPSKRWDHRGSVRLRDEVEVGTGLSLSTNRAAGYRLRFAPGTVFRTTTEIERGTAFSRPAALDRDTWLCVEELLWSFPSGLNVGLTYADNDSKDRKGTGRERTLSKSLNAERTLGRYFTGLAKVGHTDKIQGGRSGENAVGAGLRYAPPKLPVRIQLDGELAGVSGVTPTGASFDSRRHKAGVRLDGQPIKDLNVEAAVTWVKAGPSALGDMGYDGWTIESKAFLDF